MKVLGIETSCDETAAAVVAGGRTVLASVVCSQVPWHQPYGGVVPEIASRQHLAQLPGVISAARERSGLGWDELEAVAVTYGPGLASSLLVGLSAAKGLAMRLRLPLVSVNHLEAHAYAPALTAGAPAFEDLCPLVVLVVSGGHTGLWWVAAPGSFRRLGCTLDDAAGEAFDKGARLLGLGYPGGPAIERAAAGGHPAGLRFPRRPAVAGLDFSFSGLKTALRYYLQVHPCGPDSPQLAQVAAAYQEAIVEALVERLALALRQCRARRAAVAGGVAMNRRLRERLAVLAAEMQVELRLPAAEYCLDNAAMVAGLAGAGGGVSGPAAMALDAAPNLELGA